MKVHPMVSMVEQVLGLPPKEPFKRPEKPTPKMQLSIWDLAQLHDEAVSAYDEARKAEEAVGVAYRAAMRSRAAAEVNLSFLEEQIYAYEMQSGANPRTIFQVFNPFPDHTGDGCPECGTDGMTKEPGERCTPCRAGRDV